MLNYYGSQDERRHMRFQIVQQKVDFDVILTTYNMVISSAEDRVLFRSVATHELRLMSGKVDQAVVPYGSKADRPDHPYSKSTTGPELQSNFWFYISQGEIAATVS